MKRGLLFLFLLYTCASNLSAQTLQKAMQDAFMISRMVEKFHMQPRPLNDDISSAIYLQLLDQLGEQRSFFTQEDIAKLSAYQYKLDDEIRSRQTSFLQLLSVTYKQRLLQADTMLDAIGKTPFNFYSKEKLTIAEDTSYPANAVAMRAKLNKLLKRGVLNTLIAYAEISGASPSKKMIDSLEPVVRKKAVTNIKRSIKRALQSPMSIEQQVGTMFCEVLASCYDPHTAYFPNEVKNAFESELGKKPMEFGLAINEDDAGKAQISHLRPGSPAYQSGQLNEGDKIQAVQWENKEPVDVSNSSAAELDQVLGAPGGTKVALTVKKADGTTRQVTIHKAVVDTDQEENKVKSLVLKGAGTIGYISLPAFYADWEDDAGIHGCANDVAREIIQLKKENIEGLILDLRYNGGGSMQEAIELAGIFIDAGPVAQTRDRGKKVISLKDGNRGTIYDGPLLLLVNGYSASASEMVAATLQDYNRALIAGSTTYGKATAQVILPLDTTINLETYEGNATAESYIKLTVSQLYRINGKTAQATGVVPQIVLPDMTDVNPQREINEPFAIPPSSIEANKYYQPLPPLSLAAATALSAKEIAADTYFKDLQQYIEQVKTASVKRDVSLFIDEAWQARATNKTLIQRQPPAKDRQENPGFTVSAPASEQQLLQVNKELQEMDEEWKKNLLADPYIKIAYRLLSVMKK